MAGQGGAHLVLRVTRDWPWGLAIWRDLESSEFVPDRFDAAGVAAGRTVIVGPIMHEVDGPATAEVWAGEPPAGMICIYDAPFDLDSGWLTLGDAAMEQVEESTLPAGTYRARLFVDAADFPEVVSLYLTPSA